ncbi:MAG: ComEA family DNA-binding protein [Bacteroidia bacterium]
MLNYLNKYFTLNRRERNGMIAIISLVIILLMVKYFVVYHSNTETNKVVVVALDDVAAKFAEQNNDVTKDNYSTSPANTKDSLFYFNPNTINYEQAMMLGFSGKVAHTLINYRNKGGKFYKPVDLKKLYGMDEVLFDKLKPFVQLDKSNSFDTKFKPEEKETHFIKKEKQNISIEINSADSLQWIQLKGIGPGRTKMILKYRSMLGGFYATEQLKEVYYFTDSLYNTIKANLTVNPALIQKLKVNSVDFKTMVHHPYIKYEGTKCIFALKRNKKIIADDLKNSSCFSREQLEKVLLYLDFE